MAWYQESFNIGSLSQEAARVTTCCLTTRFKAVFMTLENWSGMCVKKKKKLQIPPAVWLSVPYCLKCAFHVNIWTWSFTVEMYFWIIPEQIKLAYISFRNFIIALHIYTQCISIVKSKTQLSLHERRDIYLKWLNMIIQWQQTSERFPHSSSLLHTLNHLQNGATTWSAFHLRWMHYSAMFHLIKSPIASLIGNSIIVI